MTLTNAKLIAELQKHSPNATVFFVSDNSRDYKVDGVEVNVQSGPGDTTVVEVWLTGEPIYD